MNLSSLLRELDQSAAVANLIERLREGNPGLTTSISDAAKPFVIAGLHAAVNRPTILVTARPGQAFRYADELAAWHPCPSAVILFQAPDALPYEHLAPDPELVSSRLQALVRLTQPDGSPPLLVLSARAALDCLLEPARFRTASHTLRPGQTLAPASLLEEWLELGYEPVPVVDGPGQFSRRGGILDVFPPGAMPCRIEFWGDDIETMRRFDLSTQRSGDLIDELVILPASEGGGSASVLDYLPPQGLLVFDEPVSLAAAADELQQQAEALREELERRGERDPDGTPPYRSWSDVSTQPRPCARVDLAHDPDSETIRFVHPGSFAGRQRAFLAEARRSMDGGDRVVIVSQQSARLAELMNEVGFAIAPTDATLDHSDPNLGMLELIHGALQEGWRTDELRLTVFSDRELFGWAKVHRQVRRARRAPREPFISDLEPGTLIVHVDHGIGRYLGLVRLGPTEDMASQPEQGAGREFLLIQFAGSDRLYVPIEQSDRVARYVGGGDDAPSLTRLGSGEWQRSKQRVQRAVREIAQELLELYAARQVSAGHAFPEDTVWQGELEASFPYIETPDQAEAIGEVKADMEGPRPMDRLLVGDVGYGKTEVALRAAFKAVMHGKQVAMLVPTTVLAQQHDATFRERLEPFPVRVEMLSRFRTDREQREVIEALAAGAVDICIGTHRLIQKDVRFKELGLVIIDEEQRFGVAHKERLKQLRREVDVLTLTATPIPRTLHMALVGVRDLSSIETAPEARLPIRTYVSEYDDGLVREAIIREIERGGQVYLVHNRVRTIAAVASRLQHQIPEARIGVAHGQMPEGQLEKTMTEFAAGEYDVLVCTTIIESGLDIPNVNTLIIDHAEHLGLAQLYQLRGRVGRGPVRAYAYLFYPRDTQLSEIAEKRLRTIFEATELGAGYRIAMKDLEIRGAGNLLGAEQSGHIAAVGFDLYTRLLGEAVEALRAVQDGRPIPPRARPRPSLDLPVAAYLPRDYVSDPAVRLNLYQRLAAVDTAEQLGSLVEELIDRFGPLPEPVENLAYLIGLRISAADAGVQEIAAVGGEIVVQLSQPIDARQRAAADSVLTPVRLGSNQIRMARPSGQAWLADLQRLVELLPRIA